MENMALKRQMMETYLKQQQQQSVTPTPSVVSEQVRSYQHQPSTSHQISHSTSHSTSQQPVLSSLPEKETALVLYDVPENISLEDFKNYVKKWIEYDNFIKKAKQVIKDKKKVCDELNRIIIKFMCKYNIEDINTKEGRIRCKTTVVKPAVTQKVVKQRICDYFKDNENKKEEILHKIYEEREQVEKVSLRRLKIT